jgi:predicted AlkP superfamily pyrophosphatase or phosphodiesterase
MKYKILCFFFFANYALQAQKNIATITKPKLMVGLVIDQMRWDYLYRYENRYSNNGFKRLIKDGFSCNNTFIPYTPSVTAVGHTCIYTGSVPAINGIVGNNWYNKTLKKVVYCSDDELATGIGGDVKSGKMSPVNMLTTTITDELKLATNNKSTVVGVCIKDRGAIFPAGHNANAAYWYDGKTGNWITSNYYAKALPNWLTEINNKKMANEYFKNDWNTLYNIDSYTQSTADEKKYEAKMKKETTTSFPHNLKQYTDKDFDMLSSTPYGNTFTLDVAKAAIQNYALGKNTVPDFLTISLSSTDYIGHKFGPNSIEMEDTYLRLDKDIADFLTYLDKTIGINNYTLFLTADHGVAHIPDYLKENKIPAGNWENDSMVKALNMAVKEKFNIDKVIVSEQNYQLYLNDEAIATNAIGKENIVSFIITYCESQKGIAQAFELQKLQVTTLPEPIKKMLANGYHKKRSGDIQIILEPAWIDGGNTGTTHGLWNPYDTHIPMLWYGNGINKGKTNKTMYMSDIAPTIAALLNIQMPNGCVGEVMTGVLKD